MTEDLPPTDKLTLSGWLSALKAATNAKTSIGGACFTSLNAPDAMAPEYDQNELQVSNNKIVQTWFTGVVHPGYHADQVSSAPLQSWCVAR